MNTCRSCGAKIDWIETKAGKKMPIDPEQVEFDDAEPTDILVSELGNIVNKKNVSSDPHPNQKYYVSHFATCPDADKWRGR